jgi:hypothetical protein
MKLPRNAEIWLAPYLRERLKRRLRPVKPKRAWVAITDHYEPLGMGASLQTALGRVARWRERWPRIAEDAPRDAAGQRPQYSFFYPQEEYQREVVERVAEIARLGVGDVEVHLHHDEERRQNFIDKVMEYCRRLTGEHGLLRQQEGRTAARRQMVRAGRGDCDLARSGLLCGFHHALGSIADAGADGESDLLVHEQRGRKPALLRSWD